MSSAPFLGPPGALAPVGAGGDGDEVVGVFQLVGVFGFLFRAMQNAIVNRN